MDRPLPAAPTDAVPAAPPVHYGLELLDKQQEHDDVWSFRFRRAEPFGFRAGQYVHLRLDAPHIEKPVRHMSLASAPGDDAVQFTMHVRPHSQFKLHLARLEAGTPASLFKIKGEFVLPDAAELKRTRCVFIASGIGVTPFRSILRDAAQRQLPLAATLLHVARGCWLFADELAGLPAQTQHRIGRAALPELLERTVQGEPAALYYIAGSPAFVFGQQTALKALGIAAEQIRLDNFKAYDELE